jgi:AraC-like DNA-binding protein
MGSVLLQCRDLDAVRRVLIEYGLAGSYERCDGAEELLDRVKSGAVSGIVIDTQDRQRHPVVKIVAEIREIRPALPILLWCRTQDLSAPAGRELLERGVSAVLIRRAGRFEQNTLAQFVPVDSMPYQEWIERSLDRRVAGDVRDIVAFCLRPESQRLSVPQVARRLELAPRTLAHRLQKSYLPSPLHLLEWGRLLGAAWNIGHSAVSVDRAATDAGFPSGKAFRSVLKKWTTDLPGDLRAPESFGWVLRCFEHELIRLRPPAAS